MQSEGTSLGGEEGKGKQEQASGAGPLHVAGGVPGAEREGKRAMPGVVRRVAGAVGRASTWAVFSQARAWSGLRAPQQLVLGFAAYIVIGTVLLCLPWARTADVGVLDNLFTAASAVSTTGLTTVSVADSYSLFGEFVILAMFQLGGIGFMTLSSMLIVARGGSLSDQRMGVLKAGFSLPTYFKMQHFLVQVVVFTLLCEVVGAGVLWWRFAALGVENPLWFAVFHSVSAFSTAGFSLSNSGLEPFRDDWVVNVTIGVLCYLGGIGFIVVQDVWYSVRLRERMLTLTSKVIVTTSLAIFVIGTVAVALVEPAVRGLPVLDRVMASGFQVMSASSTAGFNTISIGSMSQASLVVLVIAMIIGASPSGTGGGIKTTSVTALLGNAVSVLRGRSTVVWMGCEVPLARVLVAVAATTVYFFALAAGVFALALVEERALFVLVFEAASALSTVGLSMGITADLSAAGKVIIIALMFVGRCGPLTIGLALLAAPTAPAKKAGQTGDDLAV